MWPPVWEERGTVRSLFQWPALDANEEVCWFDIAMNDAVIVRVLQCRGGLRKIIACLLRREGPAETELLRAALQPVPERSLGEIGHHQVSDRRQATFEHVFAEMVEWQDIFVLQLGDRARLALETLGRLLPFRRLGYRAQVSADNLDGNLSADACMLSQIDVTHATSLDEPHQPIATEQFPYQRIH